MKFFSVTKGPLAESHISSPSKKERSTGANTYLTTGANTYLTMYLPLKLVGRVSGDPGLD